MTTQQENEILLTPEPTQAEEQLTKEEINKQINHYWKAIDQAKGFDEYKQAWDKYDYYRDLKTKLYK